MTGRELGSEKPSLPGRFPGSVWSGEKFITGNSHENLIKFRSVRVFVALINSVEATENPVNIYTSPRQWRRAAGSARPTASSANRHSKSFLNLTGENFIKTL